MAKPMVNIGYDDVVTPEKLDTIFPGSEEDGPYTYADLAYTAYDRTFFQTTPTEPTPFAWFNNPALTAEQTTAAYGDAWNAFTGALKAQTEKPLWGVLVPNPDNPPVAATASVAPAAAAQEETVEAVDVSVPEDEAALLDADVHVADVSVEAAADKAEAPSKPAQSAGQDDGGPARQARHGRGAD